MLHKTVEIGITPLLQGVGQAAGDQLPLFAQVNTVLPLDEFHHPLEVGIGDGDIVKHRRHSSQPSLSRLFQQAQAVEHQHGLPVGQGAHAGHQMLDVLPGGG